MNDIYYYDFGTKNESFIQVSNALRDMGIKNNKFMLKIYNADLIGVDPRDPSLTLIMKVKILEECMRNYWYFIREVVRLPIQGGDTIPYKADLSNIAQAFCMQLDIDTWASKPRQNQLVMCSLVFLSWQLLLNGTHNKININTRVMSHSFCDMGRIHSIIKKLPDYLQVVDLKYNSSKPKMIINKTAANIINARSLYRYDDSNFEANYVYISDGAFIDNIGDIIKDSRINVFPDQKHVRIFTSVRNYYGKHLEEPMIKSSGYWDETCYDMTKEQLIQYVKETDTGLMYIEYGCEALELSEEWINDMKRMFDISGDSDSLDNFKGEILMQWKDEDKNPL